MVEQLSAARADAAAVTPRPRRRPWALDLCLALVLACLAAAGSLAGGRRVGVTVRRPELTDVWFDGDVPRVSTTLVDRWSELHGRSSVHPLLPMVTLPAVAVQRALGLRADTVVTLFVTAVAFLWGASLFVLLRLAGLARPDATLFTLLGLAGAAALFWLAVPESFGLGSVTVMWGLMPAAAAARRAPGRGRVREGWFVLASAASLAIATTNWSAGLLATASANRWWRTVRASALALTAVIALWGVQKLFVPAAEFFVGARISSGEQRFTFRPTPERVAAVARVFVARSMAAPAFERVPRSYRLPGDPDPGPRRGSGAALSVQQSAGAASAWGTLAVAGWAALLLLGAWTLYDARPPWWRFAAVVALFLLAQLALHSVYGKETFLYSLDYFPALVVFAAFAALGRARRVALGLAAAVALAAAVNNVRQFDAAARFVADEAARVGLARVTPAGAAER